MALDFEKYGKQLREELDQLARELDLDRVVEETRPATDDRILNAAHVGYTGESADVSAEILDLRDGRRGQVLVAMQKIDDGTYGTCERCGKEIGTKRLDADPAAVYCIDCASLLEAGIETPTL